ncbi:MAG: DNA-3-methyladenine glycosylase [Candidatus Parcubacteria bacterium]|nr:DNA-3-methyladenine glycosylase [Candidatus Parcubacteria bacterium]
MTELQKAIQHFKKNDPILFSFYKKGIIKELKPIKKQEYFLSLCESIVYQQLSGKAAQTIYSRFEKLFSKKEITPRKILSMPDNKLRSAGLSEGKTKYIKSLAQHIRDKSLNFDNFDKLSNEEILDKLVQVKGIGPWTAEMFLMFSMGRPNVFSGGDLGIKNGMKKLYGKELTGKQIEKWSPYKTYACLLLWKSTE